MLICCRRASTLGKRFWNFIDLTINLMLSGMVGLAAALGFIKSIANSGLDIHHLSTDDRRWLFFFTAIAFIIGGGVMSIVVNAFVAWWRRWYPTTPVQ